MDVGKSRHGLVSLAALTLILLSPIARAERAQNPCTQKESWEHLPSLPKPWRNSFESSIRSTESATKSTLTAHHFKTLSTKNAALSHFADYWIARVYFEIGLIHLAHPRFSQLATLATTPSGVRSAAIGCLVRIQERLPTLALPMQTDRFSSEDLYLALESAALRGATLTPAAIARLDEGSRLAIETLSAAHRGDERGLAALKPKLLPRLKKSDPKESVPSSVRPLVALSLARGLYGQGDYLGAIEAYDRVPNTSNALTGALIEKAWAYLMLEKYSEAIGAAANLIVGGLKGTFAPESFGIAVISLYETCNYVQAIDLIKAFRKSYGPVYQWLYRWRTQGSKPDALYSTLSGFLKKTTPLPERIGLEWIRSPSFTALQEEINLLIDEKTILKSSWGKMSAPARGKNGKRFAAAFASLSREVGALNSSIPKQEAALVNQVNTHLAVLNRRMLGLLADVSENLQRVEVEALNAVGEKMITTQALGKDSTQPQTLSRDDRGPVWDWGQFDVANAEQTEVWEDELGFLRAEMKTRCSKKP